MTKRTQEWPARHDSMRGDQREKEPTCHAGELCSSSLPHQPFLSCCSPPYTATSRGQKQLHTRSTYTNSTANSQSLPPDQDFPNFQVSVDFLNTHPTPAKVAASSRACRRPVSTLMQLMVPNPRQLFQIVSFFLKPQPHPTYPLSHSEDGPRSPILGE